MAKLYIFGIGGTGSRVMQSLTMMLAAGVKINVSEIVPIIIDPDASNGNLTRTISLMNNYKKVRSYLSWNDSNKTQFFKTDINKLTQNYTLNLQNVSNKKFKEYIDMASLDRPTKAMMQMLFSDDNLNATMEVGFKGNPNIGSVVLNQIVDSSDFAAFANSFQQGDKIFIISSIFGGTGASGFPLLLKTLRHGSSFTNNALINNAEIGAITILPYFMLENNNESKIDSSTFISKTKSALAYYENNISNNRAINALYFLGDNITNIYENNEGGNSQNNHAHLIEFLAATAIIDFCANINIDTTNKEIGLNDLDDAQSVSFRNFSDSMRETLLEPLTKYIMLANSLKVKFDYYSSKSFKANDVLKQELYSSTFMNTLRQNTTYYLQWLDELKRNKRSLDLFNLNSNDKPFELITGYKEKKIISTLSNYDLLTGRLNSAIKNCKSKENSDKFMEMFDLAL